MKDRHVLDELSAYLDGEASEPRRIESHLAACSECARRHGELAALSRAMRQMTAPPVGDAFAQRVAARIRETGRETSGPVLSARRYWAAASAVLAVAACLVIAIAMLVSLRNPESPFVITRTENGSPDEAGMVAHIFEGGEPAPWDYGFAVPEETPETGEDEMVLALVDSDWFEAAATAWESEADLDELVSSLDESEKQEFEQLLLTYSQEGAGI